jgi:hypothetical protein
MTADTREGRIRAAVPSARAIHLEPGLRRPADPAASGASASPRV